MRRGCGLLRSLACLAIAVPVAASACGQDESVDPSQRRLAVLFIGSSLTYYNDLPGMLETLIDGAGFPAPRVEMLASPGAGLDTHWARSETHRVIEEGGWDVVILEHGMAGGSRLELIEYATLFAQEIRSAGGEPALYMVWPPAYEPSYLDIVADSYRLAANQVDGMLFPVGEAWGIALRLLPSVQLYETDGIHPSPVGSYLAAMVMFQGLTGVSPVGLPSTLEVPGSWVRVVLSPEEAAALQAAAVEANAKFGRGLKAVAGTAAGH